MPIGVIEHDLAERGQRLQLRPPQPRRVQKDERALDRLGRLGRFGFDRRCTRLGVGGLGGARAPVFLTTQSCGEHGVGRADQGRVDRG